MHLTYACEQSPLTLKYVSSHLTIVVTHREKPIAGVAISVVRENFGEEVFSGFTDRLGTVRMRNWKWGDILSAPHSSVSMH